MIKIISPLSPWDCFLNDVLVLMNGCLVNVEGWLRAPGLQGWGMRCPSMCGEGIHKSFWAKEKMRDWQRVWLGVFFTLFHRIISSGRSGTSPDASRLLLYCSVEMRIGKLMFTGAETGEGLAELIKFCWANYCKCLRLTPPSPPDWLFLLLWMKTLILFFCSLILSQASSVW